MEILKKINGLQIVGICLMLGSIVWNIVNAASEGDNAVFATILLPIGIAIWIIGLQRMKQSDVES